MLPTIGRIVHYRVGGTDETPELRPATIVQVWGETCVNLQVVLDGHNDSRHTYPSAPECTLFSAAECERGSSWKTSACRGDRVGEWRWPTRS